MVDFSALRRFIPKRIDRLVHPGAPPEAPGFGSSPAHGGGDRVEAPSSGTVGTRGLTLTQYLTRGANVFYGTGAASAGRAPTSVTPEVLKTSPEARKQAAKELLKSRGLVRPTEGQLLKIGDEIAAAVAGEAPNLEYRASLGANDYEQETLSSYLLATHKTRESLIAGADYELQSVARILLGSVGIDQPPQSLLLETTHGIHGALESGQDYVPSSRPSFIPQKDNVLALQGYLFSEGEDFKDAELTKDALRLAAGQQKEIYAQHASGVTGMVLAASFVNAPQRIDGNFGEAYGEDAWLGFLKAHAMLRSIPKGELLDRLNVGLMTEVNRLCFTADVHGPLEEAAMVVVRALRHDAKEPGKIRSWVSFARERESLTHDEVVNLREAGADFIDGPGGGRDQGWGEIVYAHPETIVQRLQSLVEEISAELADPNADGIAAAAKLARKFVAIHPFEDANGRTARLLMNRILDELGYAPSILQNSSADLVLTPAAWRREVAEGCARTNEFVFGSPNASGASLMNKRLSFASYLEGYGLKVSPPPPSEPILLGGLPFALGSDGLLYDVSGLPHVAIGESLEPLSQMEAYVLVRRLGSMPQPKAQERLLALTEATRNLYARVAADPALGKTIVPASDRRAREADSDYRLRPAPEVAQILVSLSKVEELGDTLFWVGSVAQKAEAPTAAHVLSKYAQVDLELWYLEEGLRATNQIELAGTVHAERAKLFTRAKDELTVRKNDALVSPENRLGFRRRSETVAYENSPLRHESLDEAIQRDGDGRINVWRGDWAISKAIGIGPNSDIRNKDARELAHERLKKGASGHLLYELNTLEGSANGNYQTASGSQYTCMTTDLTWLSSASFGGGTATHELNLSALPRVVANRLAHWVGSGELLPDPAAGGVASPSGGTAPAPGSVTPPGTAAATGAPAGGATAAGRLILGGLLHIPGTVMALTMKEEKDRVQVTLHRKIFLAQVRKENLIPGIRALQVNGSFNQEQEAHAIAAIRPWDLKKSFDHEELQKELPVMKPEQGILPLFEKAFAAGLLGNQVSPELQTWVRALPPGKVSLGDVEKVLTEMNSHDEGEVIAAFAAKAGVGPLHLAVNAEWMVSLYKTTCASAQIVFTAELESFVRQAIEKGASAYRLRNAGRGLSTEGGRKLLEELAASLTLAVPPVKADIEALIPVFKDAFKRSDLVYSDQVDAFLRSAAGHGCWPETLRTGAQSLAWSSEVATFAKIGTEAGIAPPALTVDADGIVTKAKDGFAAAMIRFTPEVEAFIRTALARGATAAAMRQALGSLAYQSEADVFRDVAQQASANGEVLAPPKLELDSAALAAGYKLACANACISSTPEVEAFLENAANHGAQGTALRSFVRTLGYDVPGQFKIIADVAGFPLPRLALDPDRFRARMQAYFEKSTHWTPEVRKFVEDALAQTPLLPQSFFRYASMIDRVEPARIISAMAVDTGLPKPPIGLG